MTRYKVTLKGTDVLTWYKKAESEAEAIGEVVHLLHEQGQLYVTPADLEAEARNRVHSVSGYSIRDGRTVDTYTGEEVEL